MTPLATRQLGRTGYDISVVGAGSWRSGAPGGSTTGARRTSNLGACAAPRGSAGRELDRHRGGLRTRPFREIVGRAIAGMPAAQRPYISPSAAFAGPTRTYSVIRCAVCAPTRSARMRRLPPAPGRRQDRPLPVHWPDSTGVQVEDSWEEMGRLIEQGKVRAGASPTSTWTARALREDPPRRLAAAAVLADRPARGGRARALVRRARHRLHLLQPLQAGLLTDTFSASGWR